VLKFKFLLVVALFAGCVAIAHASYDEAKDAYDRGDYVKAAQEFKVLAEQGNADAQCLLGTLYAKGRGMPKNNAEALRWYRAAAEQGNAKGQYYLAVIFDMGDGVPRDYAEALKWYRKAAEQGLAVAQSNLGAMYGLGQGVPRDYVRACMWLNLAAEQGYSEAQNCIEAISEKMTPDQIAEARRLAKEWKPRGTE
jgi:hypothetical protein